jgi:hypothetical protein
MKTRLRFSCHLNRCLLEAQYTTYTETYRRSAFGQKRTLNLEVRTVKIAVFLSDERLVVEWLNAQKRSLESAGIFLSYWLHENHPGFGLVIVDEKSGEFHLSQNGEVSFHIEQFDHEMGEFDVITSTCSPTTHLHEFEKLYDQFRGGVIS